MWRRVRVLGIGLTSQPMTVMQMSCLRSPASIIERTLVVSNIIDGQHIVLRDSLRPYWCLSCDYYVCISISDIIDLHIDPSQSSRYRLTADASYAGIDLASLLKNSMSLLEIRMGILPKKHDVTTRGNGSCVMCRLQTTNRREKHRSLPFRD